MLNNINFFLSLNEHTILLPQVAKQTINCPLFEEQCPPLLTEPHILNGSPQLKAHRKRVIIISYVRMKRCSIINCSYTPVVCRSHDFPVTVIQSCTCLPLTIMRII